MHKLLQQSLNWLCFNNEVSGFISIHEDRFLYLKVKNNQGPQFVSPEILGCCFQTASCLKVFSVWLQTKKIHFKKGGKEKGN